MQLFIETIERYFEQRQSLSTTNAPSELINTVQQIILGLDRGELKVAEKMGSKWQVHQWIKKAILLSFKITPNQLIGSNENPCFDKIELKFNGFTTSDFAQLNIRVVPGAVARRGSFIGPQTVLMPSFINIGAFVDSGCMIDTWATVGSCAQIGKNVHISGGTGIGGVLEPLQANPTIIEDDCFIGARSEIAEGVIVEQGSVISMGVFIGQSTKIFDRQTGEIYYGRVPAGSVVVPGHLPSKDGTHALACAVIVKKVDAQTRSKTSINELLRAD